MSAFVITLVLFLASGLAFAWFALREANLLETSDVVFNHALIRSKVRVLFLSDLHLYQEMPQKRLQGIKETLKRLSKEYSFDLVVITGDTLDHDSGLPLLPEVLDCLPEKALRFAVLGNHDLKMYNLLHLVFPLFRRFDHKKINIKALEEVFKEYSVRLLRNESLPLKLGETTVQLTGIEPDNPGPIDIPVSKYFHLLLSHYPEAVRDYRGLVDMVLAGHTHGGQICWFGTPLVTRSKMKGAHARGVSIHGKTAMLVSRGIGSSYYIPFRLGAIPEIITLTLEGVYE